MNTMRPAISLIRSRLDLLYLQAPQRKDPHKGGLYTSFPSRVDFIFGRMYSITTVVSRFISFCKKDVQW